MSYKGFIGSDSWTRGQKKESEFGKLLVERYPEARPATFQEQVRHIDWICDKGTIDVKAMKRVSRSSNIQSEFIWVEFKGNAGRAGWLYGNQDYVAFEAPEKFVIVRRADLQTLAEKLCDLDDRVSVAKDALYKNYTRKGKLDEISMIRFDDLFKIENFSITKHT
jgi:hypothetical protein